MPSNMVEETAEFRMNERWDDGDSRLKDLDIITRRYIEFCNFTGQEFDQYVGGISQEDFDNFIAISKSPEGHLRKTTINKQRTISGNESANLLT